jgi:microcystin-dependent protein
MAKLLNLLRLRSFNTAADSAVEVAITSDTQPRLRVDAGGKHTWGAGGTTAGDTTLYRSAADTLKTDDAFIAAGGLTVKTIEIDPASASSGQVLQYDGTKFAPTTPSRGATVSDNVPSSPTTGQVWFESDTGKTFVYYDSYWVEISGGRGDTNPVGSVTAFAGATAPASWLLCAGQAVSRTVYASLFATIGTTYGAGDGSTTFAVPDLRGRTVAGLDNMGGTDAGRLDIANSSGTVVGSQYVTLTSAEMPSHTHTQNSHNHTQNSHNHSQNSHNHSQNAHAHNFTARWQGSSAVGVNMSAPSFGTPYGIGGGYVEAATATNIATTATNIATTATNIATTATNQHTGGDGAHNNMQPTMVLNYIIKAL